jgi:hypothetical protein
MPYLKFNFLNAEIAWFALGLAVGHIYAIWGRSISFGSPYLVICQMSDSIARPCKSAYN